MAARWFLMTQRPVETVQIGGGTDVPPPKMYHLKVNDGKIVSTGLSEGIFFDREILQLEGVTPPSTPQYDFYFSHWQLEDWENHPHTTYTTFVVGMGYVTYDFPVVFDLPEKNQHHSLMIYYNGFLSTYPYPTVWARIPGRDTEITCVYTKVLKPEPKYSLSVINGTGSGYYLHGASVEIVAKQSLDPFKIWKGSEDSDPVYGTEEPLLSKTYHIQPPRNATVTATYTSTIEFPERDPNGFVVLAFNYRAFDMNNRYFQYSGLVNLREFGGNSIFIQDVLELSAMAYTSVTYVLSTTGDVYSQGASAYGAVGNGITNAYQETLGVISSQIDSGIRKITVNDYGLIALNNFGEIFGCGYSSMREVLRLPSNNNHLSMLTKSGFTVPYFDICWIGNLLYMIDTDGYLWRHVAVTNNLQQYSNTKKFKNFIDAGIVDINGEVYIPDHSGIDFILQTFPFEIFSLNVNVNNYKKVFVKGCTSQVYTVRVLDLNGYAHVKGYIDGEGVGCSNLPSPTPPYYVPLFSSNFLQVNIPGKISDISSFNHRDKTIFNGQNFISSGVNIVIGSDGKVWQATNQLNRPLWGNHGIQQSNLCHFENVGDIWWHVIDKNPPHNEIPGKVKFTESLGGGGYLAGNVQIE